MSPAALRRLRFTYLLHADLGTASAAAIEAAFPMVRSTLDAMEATGLATGTAVIRAARSVARCQRRTGKVRYVAMRSPFGVRMAIAARRLHPDVVHVNGFVFPFATIILRAVLGSQVRIVVQHHGEAPATGWRRWAQRAAGRAIDAVAFTGAGDQVQPWRVAGVVGTNTDVCEVLEAASTLEALPYAQARAATGITGDPAVLWVGRLVDGKDPLTAVQAFAALLPHRPNAHLWMMATDRHLEAEVRAAVEAAGVADAVHLVGPVAHAEMACWFSAADVYLSTSHHEAAGFSLLEALSCGCTPVVTALAPYRAILGPLGATFAPGDRQGAAAALAAAPPADRDAVISYAAAHLGWLAIAEQLLAAYGAPAAKTSRAGRS